MVKLEKFQAQSGGALILGGIYYPEFDKEPPLPLVVFCHGIPSPRAAPAPAKKGMEEDEGYPGLARSFSEEGFISCYFNFRGTGDSGGDFNLLMWQKDLKEVLNYLTQKPMIDKNNLFLVGFSGGAATAACVAAKDKRAKGVVLAASPHNFKELFPESRLKEIMERGRETGLFRTPGYPSSPGDWLTQLHQVNPLDVVRAISPRPLLIIHGDKDELVPLKSAQLLYAEAEEPKELKIITGGIHQLRKEPLAVQVIKDWLEKNIKNR